jgi:hypothetical protein
MPSSYTTSLKLTLPVQGELSGTWGDTVNTGITSLLDAAVAGTANVTMTDANYTLTSVDGAADEARQMFIVLTGTLSVARNVICPSASKLYFVKNSTTGGFAITFKTSAGTGISVPNGSSVALYCNGTDVLDAITYANIPIINATTIDTTNLEVTNIKAKDGTASIVLADSTGVATINAAPILTALTASQAVFTNASKALVSNAITGTGNVVMSASPTLTGTITAAAANFSGAVALGDAAADNITVNGTVTSNLIFTDNTYDIGATGATRPRNLFLAGNATVGGDIVLTGALDVTNLEVTNIKAKDGTASISLADTTGIATFSKATVVSTTDNTNAALRITQLGTGNALLVEDSTNPDSSPFLVDNGGTVISGYTASVVTAGSAVAPRIQVHGLGGGNASAGVSSWSTGADVGPSLVLSRSEGGVIGTQTIVDSGDGLGTIRFAGSDGTAFIQAATIFAAVDGTPGTNDMPGRLVFSTTADGASTPTERVRIDSTGQTKFSYNAVVEVTDNTNAALRITQLGTGNAFVVEDSTSPDSTPFVVGAGGELSIGQSSGPDSGGFKIQIEQANTGSNSGGVRLRNIVGNLNSSYLVFEKARSSTYPTPTIVSSGDRVGGVAGYGYDGSAYLEAARVYMEVDGTPGTNDMPGRLVFSTTADGASTPTERVRITSAGNVGIGTSSPVAKLDVAGNAIISTTDNTNAALRITQLGTGNALLVEDSTNPDATPFVIDASGFVVAGYTTSSPATLPNTKLVQSHAAAGGAGYTATRWDATANGPQVILGKSRGGAVGTLGIVADGDVLGQILFTGDDGTDLVTSGATITASVDGTPGTNDMPGRLVFSTTANGASSPTERMRIDSSGNVGIGTSSPQNRLTIQDTGSGANIGMMVRNGDATNFHRIGIGYNAGSTTGYIPANAVFVEGSLGGGFGALGGLAIGTGSSAPIIFGTNSTERARIDTSGNLLVGTTTAFTSDSYIHVPVASATKGAWVSNTATTSSRIHMRFENPNGVVGSISTSGSATAYTTSSDYRLKNTIAPMTGALAKVALLKPVTYKWNVDGSDGQGFIAHELAEVEPGCVTGEKDAVDAVGNPQYQGIDVSFLVATLTAALQELKAIVDAQAVEIAALKAI